MEGKVAWLMFASCLLPFLVCGKRKAYFECPSNDSCENLPIAPVCAIQKLPGEKKAVFVTYDRECSFKVAECNIVGAGGEIRRDKCATEAWTDERAEY